MDIIDRTIDNLESLVMRHLPQQDADQLDEYIDTLRRLYPKPSKRMQASVTLDLANAKPIIKVIEATAKLLTALELLQETFDGVECAAGLKCVIDTFKADIFHDWPAATMHEDD